jgi:putative ABC transport system ATP-binding protein
MTPTSIIEVDELTRVYGTGEVKVRALHDVPLRMLQGDMVRIMGKSGSGKSTLLHQLGLLDRPSSGRVVLNGVDVTAIREGPRRTLGNARTCRARSTPTL